VTRLRKILLGIVALVICAVLAVVLWPEKPEPVYKGTKLSEWVKKGAKMGFQYEATLPLRVIGTNGIPFYQEWIRYEPGLLKVGYFKLAEKAHAKFGLKWVRQDYHSIRAIGALNALAMLRDKAEPAIPQLVFCVTRFPRTEFQRFKATSATQILAGMGRPAVPAYSSLMTNADPRVRALALDQIQFYDGNTALVARAQMSFQDSDPLVRAAATNTLFQIARRQAGKSQH
jgi:hypothetical protein